ncbi:MAG TPA: glycosyltransferase family 2 protein [Roseiflexaceae bacterium]|nr:glycosyltransferase family 2 protein [Roseiflexaceae bacterium]
MRTPPTIRELPPPPPGRTGWPWTEAPLPLPETMPGGAPWPRITVVTPSFNQAQFLEETIRSVLLQGYPNLEYMVIDGGSTDGSAAIIERYAPWLSFWVSERDRGQAHAINKGFDRATGDLVGWINSDDLLLPGALARVAAAHHTAPDALILGDVNEIDERGQLRCHYRQANVSFATLFRTWERACIWSQPGTFVPLALHRAVGPLDERLRFVFDLDWMLRLLLCAPVRYLHVPIASFRLHGGSKTVGEVVCWFPEYPRVFHRFADHIPGQDRWLARAELELWGAIIPLSIAYRDWRRGVTMLLRSLSYDVRILRSRRFYTLAVAALLPLPALRVARDLLGVRNV